MDIDFMILADGAQIAGDKLYVLGGGWTIIWSKEFPIEHNGALAVGTLVDWSETNQKHTLEIVLLSEDGQQVGQPLLGGEFDVGRPPGVLPGTPQRFMVAANVNFALAKPGAYSVVTRLDGDETGRTVFNAIHTPAG